MDPSRRGRHQILFRAVLWILSQCLQGEGESGTILGNAGHLRKSVTPKPSLGTHISNLETKVSLLELPHVWLGEGVPCKNSGICLWSLALQEGHPQPKLPVTMPVQLSSFSLSLLYVTNSSMHPLRRPRTQYPVEAGGGGEVA